MAEGQGFEPWEPLDSPVFKTGAFGHSATPPKDGRRFYRVQRKCQYTSLKKLQKNLKKAFLFISLAKKDNLHLKLIRICTHS